MYSFYSKEATDKDVAPSRPVQKLPASKQKFKQHASFSLTRHPVGGLPAVQHSLLGGQFTAATADTWLGSAGTQVGDAIDTPLLKELAESMAETVPTSKKKAEVDDAKESVKTTEPSAHDTSSAQDPQDPQDKEPAAESRSDSPSRDGEAKSEKKRQPQAKRLDTEAIAEEATEQGSEASPGVGANKTPDGKKSDQGKRQGKKKHASNEERSSDASPNQTSEPMTPAEGDTTISPKSRSRGRRAKIQLEEEPEEKEKTEEHEESPSRQGTQRRVGLLAEENDTTMTPGAAKRVGGTALGKSKSDGDLRPSPNFTSASLGARAGTPMKTTRPTSLPVRQADFAGMHGGVQ